MESGSWWMVLLSVEAIPVAPDVLPGGLKKKVALEVFGPLKILHVSSTRTIFLMPENGRMENNCLAWGALGASQKLQDDVSGSRKRWVCWLCHALSLAQKQHTWVSTPLPPEGLNATEEWILRVSNTIPSLNRWEWGTERRRDWPRGTQQVELMFFQGRDFEK